MSAVRGLNRRSLLAAGLATALPAPAWACRELGIFVDGETRFLDRSWVRSNAVLYGTDYYRGAFRLRLDAEGVDIIGDRKGLLEGELSQDKRWLKSGYWLYDIRAGRETSLVDVFGREDHRTIRFSPKGDLLAAPSATDQVLRVLVLETNEVRIHSLESMFRDDPIPRHPEDQKILTTLFGVAWSRDGQRVLLSRSVPEPKQIRLEHWAIDIATGERTAVDAVRDGGTWWPSIISYREKGIDIGAPCMFCGLPEAVAELPLEGGGRASLMPTRGLVVVDRAGKETIAATAERMPIRAPAEHYKLECGGPGLVLLGVIDGRYLIYNRSGVYWLYGVREDRIALLSPGPSGVTLIW